MFQSDYFLFLLEVQQDFLNSENLVGLLQVKFLGVRNPPRTDSLRIFKSYTHSILSFQQFVSNSFKCFYSYELLLWAFTHNL
jgi:hypothetical protein